MTKKKEDVVHVERNIASRQLKCILTDDDRLHAGQCFADAHAELEQHNEDLDAIKSEFKGKIGQAAATIQRQSGLLRSGYEYRNTEVEIVKNFDAAVVTVTRQDTLEEIECRAMTEDEKQMNLNMKEEK